jgi:hypothetical protein
MQRPLTLREIGKVLNLLTPSDNRAHMPSMHEKSLYDINAANMRKDMALDNFVFAYKGMLEDDGPSYMQKKMAAQQSVRDFLRESSHIMELVKKVNGWI